jgi:outer membrane protein OmpA-like peptidoglycan-associated protein
MGHWISILLGSLLAIVGLVMCRSCEHEHASAAAIPAPATLSAVNSDITLAFDAGRIRLSGPVPDATARETLLAQARALPDVATVIDELVIQGGVDATQRRVLLQGEVPSDSVRTEIAASVTELFGASTAVDNRLTVAASAVAESRIDAVLELQNVEFVSGSAEFTAAGLKTVDAVAGILRESAARFEVGGHTDSLGDPAANDALSLARANAVIAYLSSHGLDRSRFVARGYGASKPLATNDNREGRQRNRRIEFTAIEWGQP